MIKVKVYIIPLQGDFNKAKDYIIGRIIEEEDYRIGRIIEGEEKYNDTEQDTLIGGIALEEQDEELDGTREDVEESSRQMQSRPE